MVISLEAHERERFASWLEQEAETTDGIVEQMKKTSIPQEMVRLMKAEAGAFTLIARKLRSIEDQTISVNDSE